MYEIFKSIKHIGIWCQSNSFLKDHKKSIFEIVLLSLSDGKSSSNSVFNIGNLCHIGN